MLRFCFEFLSIPRSIQCYFESFRWSWEWFSFWIYHVSLENVLCPRVLPLRACAVVQGLPSRWRLHPVDKSSRQAPVGGSGCSLRKASTIKKKAVITRNLISTATTSLGQRVFYWYSECNRLLRNFIISRNVESIDTRCFAWTRPLLH